MSNYKDWLKSAYKDDGTANKALWDKYLPLEQAVYEELLSTGTNSLEGTLAELAQRFGMDTEYVFGFIDGINDCLETKIEIEELNADSRVELSFEFERLYKKMVEYKAEHLYNLPQWESVIPAEHRRDLYYEQKKSGTIVKEAKPGRNDPCSCGSGKKYKKCCGA